MKHANFKKKVFDNPDGQYLLKLQQSYNDDRFKITDSFQDAVDHKRLSAKTKLDTSEARTGKFLRTQNSENDNLLRILGEIMPQEKRFLENDLKYKNNSEFLI